MNLAKALRLSSAPKLVLVGSGGKTTALFRIARQLLSPVLVTSTTHLAIEQISLADHHFVIESADDLGQLFSDLPQGVLLLTAQFTGNNRVAGLSPQSMQLVFSLALDGGLPLLVEADGSQLRPLKAPADYEPAIPNRFLQPDLRSRDLYRDEDSAKQFPIDEVIVVSGLSGLNKPLTHKWVHRPEQFASLSGIKPGERISYQGLVRVLLHPQGGLKNIPPQTRRLALLNQADTLEDQSLASQVASELLPTYHAVITSSLVGRPPTSSVDSSERKAISETEVLAVNEPVVGIVLAAGGSRRLGRPKQLLDWRGQTLVRHVVTTALSAGLTHVIVVLGAHSDEIKMELADFSVILVNNDDWEHGQSTSVRASLEALPEETGAVVFLLVDQPRVSEELIRSLVTRHATTLAPIVAPMIDGKRGNPVLFDRETFADLKSLQGDVGGRALFDRYPITYVESEETYLMLDIDTEEDYQQLLLSSD